jgi:4-hydroxybutyrate CoA-transferase
MVDQAVSTAGTAPRPAEYLARLTTAAEAVKVVRPGDRVMIPIGSTPLALADALAARLAGELAGTAGVEIAHCAGLANYAWYQPGYPGVARVVHEHWGSPNVRAYLRARQHDYLPIPFANRFKALADGDLRTAAEQRRADVVLVQVSPPDANGYVALGMAWNQRRFVESARHALAEVSPHVPRCFGDTLVHVSRFHALVEHDNPGRLAMAFEPTATHRRIAAYVAEILRDGDTVQIGAGKVTAGIAAAGVMDGKRDLGWHSEASYPSVIDLVRAGVITGARKTLDRGKAVAVSFAGTPEQMAFITMNPLFEVREPEYVHNLRTIAGLDNMVAINAALAVDLTGQITAESWGVEMTGGTGGQTEFVIGALNARGGRSIHVLESTSPDGSASRIVGTLPAGTVITVPRLYADLVVTEHGVARLWGKTIRERARELINVAHPKFRDELRFQAREVCGL